MAKDKFGNTYRVGDIIIHVGVWGSSPYAEVKTVSKVEDGKVWVNKTRLMRPDRHIIVREGFYNQMLNEID